MPVSAFLSREAAIFKVEENGSESCDLSTNSSFVLVRVPLLIEAADEKDEAAFHYSIGPFCGRDTPLALEEDEPTILRFRIPLELFRARERFVVEVLAQGATGTMKVVWVKRWTVVWQGRTPALEPLAE
jgi:hypothetical protein